MKKILLGLLFAPVSLFGQAGGETCGSATNIASLPFTGNGSTASAVDDYNYTCPSTNSTPGSKDHVYKYTTGTSTEYLTFTLCTGATNFDTKMYIYEGSCTGTPIQCSEDVCTAPFYSNPYISRLDNVALNASTTFYIIIDGYDAGEDGNYTLNVTQGTAPTPTIIPFTDMSSLLPTTTFHSGNAVGISDMNGDGRDDIVRAAQNAQMYIDYQPVTPGNFTEASFTNPIGDPWGMCIADVNNDGKNDVLYGDYGSVYILTANATATAYTEVDVAAATSAPFIFVQGANFFDINNDGNVDAFVCNDVDMSHIYVNDGAGGWTMDNSIMPLATVPASDNSGNYASIWTDINGDEFPDLFITHCRQSVTNPNDPRRINQIFLNNGDYTFTQDVTNASGLRLPAQSWSTDFADIDNDGDMDCFILSYDVESWLMENDGNGVFTNIISTSGISGTTSFFGLNAVFKDFNNDCFVDLLITGEEQRLYVNNGDKTFTLDNGNFVYGINNIYSQAVGDLNHDGYLDVYASYCNNYNNPSSTKNDKLWMNDATAGNNYAAFDLVGVQSNKNGIGAIIKAYGPWGVQIREIRSGEAYGIHNTFTAHFGLKDATEIDQLLVYWPSGAVDEFFNLPANQFMTITEGMSPETVGEQDKNVTVRVYPNPANSTVTFDIKEINLNNVTIMIKDVTGRDVMNINNVTNYISVDVSTLPAGPYMYQIVNNGDVLKAGKLIKE